MNNTKDSKDNFWTDKLVEQFAAKFLQDRINWAVLHDYAAAPVPLQLAIEKFKQSQPLSSNGGKDWEILERKNQSGAIHYESKVESNRMLYENAGCTIYKVKILSDNSIWTVGDETHLGKIIKFEIHDGQLFWWNENTWYYLHQLIKPPEPIKEVLFTTVDGKDIRDDDNYWQVGGNFEISGYMAFLGSKYSPSYTRRSFSTEGTAKYFCLMNRPSLSVKEVLKLYAESDYFPAEIERLAKSKTNL